MSGVVGRRFKAWDDVTYLCDSYDTACGYWMTPVDPATDQPRSDFLEPDDPRYYALQNAGRRRKCVSERAIGRTFRRVRGPGE